MGCIAFSPLAQGLLTDKYIKEIPASSRVGRGLTNGAIQQTDLSPETLKKVKRLNEIAVARGQSLAQMALAWLLKDRRITSVLVGASSASQLDSNIHALLKPEFRDEELMGIEHALAI